MDKWEYLEQARLIMADWDAGIITTSDRNAYLDDLDREYWPTRYFAEVAQVTSRGTRTDLR